METWAILGIGNPGARYERTYHNAGIMFVESSRAQTNAPWKGRDAFSYAREAERDVVLARAETFMNESGRAASALVSFFKLDPERLIVAHDDTDIELGKSKLVFSGNAAGHHGVESIIEQLGTKGFWRLKLGVRPRRFINTEVRVKAMGFVLASLPEEDYELLYGAFEGAAKLASNVIEKETPSGPDRTSVTGSKTRESDASPSSARLKESS